MARKEKESMPCPKGGTVISQIKQINVKVMLCYVFYCGRESIGSLPLYIKYKGTKYSAG